MNRGTPLHRPAAAIVAGLGLLTLTAACSSPTSPTPTPGGPTLACPADLELQSVDASPVRVTYQAPAAVGGAAPVTVSCAPPSGSTFAPGATQVTCTATDHLARTATCGFSVRVAVPPRLKLTRFMAFGDSITEGKLALSAPLFKLVDFPDSYPSRLQRLLAARYKVQTVTMAPEGVGGETTARGLVRLPGLLSSERPEVLLLLEGVNDISTGDPTKIPAALANLRQMVWLAKGSGAIVYLGALLPEVEGGSRAGAYALVPTFNLQLKGLADSEGAIFVDTYTELLGAVSTYIGPDGLHPSAAGYQKIAEVFFAGIKSTLEIPGVLTSDGTAPIPGRVVPDEPAIAAAQASPRPRPRRSLPQR